MRPSRSDARPARRYAVLLALGVTLLAGLATSVGGVIGTRSRMVRPGAMAVALAFAAGLMLTISLVEIAPAALDSMTGALGRGPAVAAVLGAMALGAGVVYALRRLLPHRPAPGVPDVRGLDPTLLRSGVLIALVVTLHNLPEGLATFLSTVEDPAGGVVLAFAIAIHNVPEGLAVAAPIYVATRNRRQAMLWATLSGLAEPAGGLLGYLALRALLPPAWLDLSLALVAGMMIAVSLLELVPGARRYAVGHREVLVGLFLGAVVMVLSLALLRR
ncbi:ZIP family metal transporter [Serinicoccus chungangensis]|uniref:ZIP family metal transporter n=1 Tax=Serinicoccus chungangensis TaxID=767452 RepID=UPI00128F45AD|nr:ZIP family metal transporter [Serinicoccus chungangensis]